jgi:hypothetical protein
MAWKVDQILRDHGCFLEKICLHFHAVTLVLFFSFASLEVFGDGTSLLHSQEIHCSQYSKCNIDRLRTNFARECQKQFQESKNLHVSIERVNSAKGPSGELSPSNEVIRFECHAVSLPHEIEN